MGSSKRKPGGSLKRRDMLKALTALPAAALVPLTPALGATQKSQTAAKAAQQAAAAYQRKILSDHEWKAIRVLSDLILPADERSGSATQAGVPEFIDDWLDFKRGELLDQIRGGLTWLDLECNRLFAHDFADCTEAQQKQMLDRIAYPKKSAPEDANAVAFFSHLRDLVASGYFSSKMGVEDLPYLGNKMVADWEGCPADVRAAMEKNLLKHGVELKLGEAEVKG
jgi:Gluconate 2-dehydrogenase subunit 3